MTAAMSVNVTVGVDWGVPPAATVLPYVPSSTAVRHGDSARLYTAWLPGALKSAPWDLARAHVLIRRGDGLCVRIPVADATAAATPAGGAAVPFFATAGRNVAVLAVQSCLKALEEAEDRELIELAKRGETLPEGGHSEVRV
jgi:hypothetical protein